MKAESSGPALPDPNCVTLRQEGPSCGPHLFLCQGGIIIMPAKWGDNIKGIQEIRLVKKFSTKWVFKKIITSEP